MASKCKVFLIGNAGGDAELRMTPNGKEVCEFSVAINKGTKEQNLPADWYRVSCWGRQATVAQQYIKKGTQVFVEGRLSPRLYTDKNGATRLSLDVNCDDFTLLGSREHAEQGATAPAPAATQQFDPDEIPI